MRQTLVTAPPTARGTTEARKITHPQLRAIAEVASQVDASRPVDELLETFGPTVTHMFVPVAYEDQRRRVLGAIWLGWQEDGYATMVMIISVHGSFWPDLELVTLPERYFHIAKGFFFRTYPEYATSEEIDSIAHGLAVPPDAIRSAFRLSIA